jgi:transcription antitermination factor NusG
MNSGSIIQARFPENRPLEDDLGSWWVLHTRPNCEKAIATYLLHREISYYLPLYRQTVKVGNLGRTRTSDIPLFNGYICFALDREDHRLLYDTKKFVRIITVEDQELFVKELDGISKAVETEMDLLVHRGLVPGRRVRILSGPLAGHEGVVMRSRGEKKVALSVHMFNQSVVVKLDPLTGLELL